MEGRKEILVWNKMDSNERGGKGKSADPTTHPAKVFQRPS